MKKIFFFFALIGTSLCYTSQAQTSGAVVTTIPANFTALDNVKIIVDVSAVGNLANKEPLYIWTWFPNGTITGNGDWANSNEAKKMVKEGPNKWSWTVKPSDFYATMENGVLTPLAPALITQMKFLVKAKDGSGDAKTNDIELNVNPLIFTPTDFRTFPSIAGQNEIMKVYFDQTLVKTDLTSQRMTPVSADVTVFNDAGIQVGGVVNKPVQMVGNKLYSFAVLPRVDFSVPAATTIVKMKVTYKGTMLDANGGTINVTSQPYEKLFDVLK